MTAQEPISTRPYLIRALYEWCIDNGFTPHVIVRVDDSVLAPREYVKDGEIILNIDPEAASALQLGNECMEFKARFGGKSRAILVPMGRVVAIYARENGQGMAFAPLSADMLSAESQALAPTDAPAPSDPTPTTGRVVQLVASAHDKTNDDGDAPRPPPASGGARPTLKRVK